MVAAAIVSKVVGRVPNPKWRVTVPPGPEYIVKLTEDPDPGIGSPGSPPQPDKDTTTVVMANPQKPRETIVSLYSPVPHVGEPTPVVGEVQKQNIVTTERVELTLVVSATVGPAVEAAAAQLNGQVSTIGQFTDDLSQRKFGTNVSEYLSSTDYKMLRELAGKYGNEPIKTEVRAASEEAANFSDTYETKSGFVSTATPSDLYKDQAFGSTARVYGKGVVARNNGDIDFTVIERVVLDTVVVTELPKQGPGDTGRSNDGLGDSGSDRERLNNNNSGGANVKTGSVNVQFGTAGASSTSNPNGWNNYNAGKDSSQKGRPTGNSEY